MTLKVLPNCFILNVALFFFLFHLNAQENHALEGRWDLTLLDFEGKEEPSWLEIRHSGYATYVGRFVFAFGSARPVSEVAIFGDRFTFSIPRQWEDEGNDMVVYGELKNNALSGTLIYTDGSIINWQGVRAPKFSYNDNPIWGMPIALFNGKNLEGWHVDREENQWMVKDGILTSPKSGANLISNEKFQDFKLVAEFRFPKNSNSGIYLRGRYEVQIADNHGLPPSDIYFGGVYGFLEPNTNAAKPAKEWQKYEITLIGSSVTIIANGKTIISNQNIPGITGGALDSKESEPGPIMIQGDHGPIEFKSLVLVPIKGENR